jgi:hypothetical protein
MTDTETHCLPDLSKRARKRALALDRSCIGTRGVELLELPVLCGVASTAFLARATKVAWAKANQGIRM